MKLLFIILAVTSVALSALADVDHSTVYQNHRQLKPVFEKYFDAFKRMRTADTVSGQHLAAMVVLAEVEEQLALGGVSEAELETLREEATRDYEGVVVEAQQAVKKAELSLLADQFSDLPESTFLVQWNEFVKDKPALKTKSDRIVALSQSPRVLQQARSHFFKAAFALFFLAELERDGNKDKGLRLKLQVTFARNLEDYARAFVWRERPMQNLATYEIAFVPLAEVAEIASFKNPKAAGRSLLRTWRWSPISKEGKNTIWKSLKEAYYNAAVQQRQPTALATLLSVLFVGTGVSFVYNLHVFAALSPMMGFAWLGPWYLYSSMIGTYRNYRKGDPDVRIPRYEGMKFTRDLGKPSLCRKALNDIRTLYNFKY